MLHEQPLPVGLGQRGIPAQPSGLRNPIDGRGMALGFLPQIQARERDAERRHAAQDVGEAAGRDHLVAGRHQRPKAQLERFGELRRGEVRRDARQLRRRFRERLFGQIARRFEAIAHFREQHAIRFVRVADSRAKLVARMRRRQRQLAAQRDDVLQIQVGGLPAREPCGLPRHLRRDAGVAVAIAANPRSEPYRRDVARQRRAGRRGERAIDGAQILRKRVPEALLEHDEPRTHFVERASRASRRTSSVCQAAAISR